MLAGRYVGSRARTLYWGERLCRALDVKIYSGTTAGSPVHTHTHTIRVCTRLAHSKSQLAIETKTNARAAQKMKNNLEKKIKSQTRTPHTHKTGDNPKWENRK